MAGRWRDVCGVRIDPAELRFSDTVPGSRYRAALTVQNLRAGTCRLQLLPPNRPQVRAGREGGGGGCLRPPLCKQRPRCVCLGPRLQPAGTAAERREL